MEVNRIGEEIANDLVDLAHIQVQPKVIKHLVTVHSLRLSLFASQTPADAGVKAVKDVCGVHDAEFDALPLRHERCPLQLAVHQT